MPRRGRRNRFHFSPLDWVGSLTPDEADALLAHIHEVTPQDNSLASQRIWVINLLILQPAVVSRGYISQKPSHQRLLRVFGMTPKLIEQRLWRLWQEVCPAELRVG